MKICNKYGFYEMEHRKVCFRVTSDAHSGTHIGSVVSQIILYSSLAIFVYRISTSLFRMA